MAARAIVASSPQRLSIVMEEESSISRRTVSKLRKCAYGSPSEMRPLTAADGCGCGCQPRRSVAAQLRRRREGCTTCKKACADLHRSSSTAFYLRHSHIDVSYHHSDRLGEVVHMYVQVNMAPLGLNWLIIISPLFCRWCKLQGPGL